MGAVLILASSGSEAADISRGANNFYASDKVNAQKVKFKNAYGNDLTGIIFTPKDMEKGKKISRRCCWSSFCGC